MGATISVRALHAGGRGRDHLGRGVEDEEGHDGLDGHGAGQSRPGPGGVGSQRRGQPEAVPRGEARAAKVALRDGRRLKVVFELADPETNALVKGYFRNLKAVGLEFDAANSSRCRPLAPEEFRQTLATIEGKPKDSRMLQVADAYLWAISKGKYFGKLDLWRRVVERQRLINAQLPVGEAGVMGIKYYCFGGVPAAASTVAAPAS